MIKNLSRLFLVWITLATILGMSAYAGQTVSRDNESRDGRKFSGRVKQTTLQSLKKTKSLAVQNKIGYGILLYDDVEEDKANCFVSFNLPDVQTFNKVQNLGMYTSAGAYADGKYYFSETKVINQVEIPGRLYEIAISTGKVTLVGAFSGYDNYIADMSYDYSTKTMYGVAKLKNGNSALYKINLEDASSEKVVELDRYFYTMACSYGGQLYGVSRTGDFCKINKVSGAVELIGATGLAPTLMQTMEFDHTDKTLYWAAVLMPGDVSCMATIDLKTGVADMVGDLGNAAEIVGLYIPFTASADATPAAVSAMSVEAGKNGTSEATLQWVNPTQTFGGGTLDGTFKVEIYRNDELIETKNSPKPGEKETYIDKVTGITGLLAKYKIVPVNSAGKGVAKESTVFVGKDVPAAPVNLNLVKNGYDKVRLSWEAPAIGKNGGWMDAGSITYKVIRMPDNNVMAENLKAPSCEDINITPAATYTYKVIAQNNAGEGGVAETAGYILGPKLVLPYYGDFGKSSVVNTWTVIDNNNDKSTWRNANHLTAKKNVMIYQSSSTLDADEWLVSHTFPLVKDQTYKVSFIIQTLVGNNLRFVLGKDANVAALTEEIAKYEKIVYSDFTTLSFTFVAKETGDSNLGIQLYSAKNSSWTYIADVNIEPIVSNDLVAVSLNGNENPIAGNTYEYEFTVRNRGTQAQGSYTLNLMDASQDTVLVSKKIEERIEPEAVTSIVMSWKATSEAVKELSGQVVCPGENILSNNRTEILPIRVQSPGSSEIVDIKGIASSKLHPFNFYETKSAAMNIYMADEIKQIGGVIEKLIYSYNSGWSKDVENTPVKVYLGNTERTNTLGGWISEDSLVLVYDGVATIKKGENQLEIPLDKYLVYEGKNLAILTIQSMPSGYANSINFPYYVSKQENNRVLLWKGGTKDSFNFTVKGSQGTSNSAVRFDMLCDGATISGKVEDINIPLDSAVVTLKERKMTVMTNSDGNFVFNYVPDGTYTLLCSRHGYPDAEMGNIKVVNKQNAVQNIRMTNLPVYKLEGKVIDAKGQPLNNASVKLSGYENMTATTSEDGKFVFQRVLSATGYNLVIQKEFYKPVIRTVDLTVDIELSTVTLDYFLYSPVNVSPEVIDGVATVKWETPDKPISFRKDDGTVQGQTGITNGAGKVVMGVVHRVPTMITEVSWYTTREGGPHNIMHLYIYDLDENGNPVNEVLYNAQNISNSDNTWNIYKLPQPVEAPNGFMIALNYPGYIGLGVDSGKDITYPFENKTYSFSANYENGKFDYLEGKGLNQNLLIRASGYAIASNPEPTVKAEQVSVPADFWTYKVWRLAGKDTDSPEKWTLLTLNPINVLQFEDQGLKTLLPDVYRYAVGIVCPDGKESKPMLSQYVAHNMITNVTVKVKTNSEGAKAQGASVALTNEKGDVLTQTVVENNQIVFADLWKGKYKLVITMEGYDEIKKDVDFSLNNEYVTEEFLLKESIVTPRNLSVRKEGSNVMFDWNTSDNIFEDFESHDDFTINSAGKLSWQYNDADGADTYCFGNNRFPGDYYPKAYVILNPSAMTPPMTNAKIQPHSGSRFLASFSADSETGNDDYLISPELRFVDEFTLSFYAKSYSNSYNYTDPFCVGYSKTGTEPGDFEWIAENVVPQDESWQKYTYKIPADARYVTIRCVSTNGFVLMIDDIFIGYERTNKVKSVSSNVPQYVYEVYLDGVKVATTNDCSYIFQNVSAGNHVAGVKSVYYSGASNLVTCNFEMESGVHSETMQPIRIYPNPAKEYVMVEGEYTRLELHDVSGRPVAYYEGQQDRIDVSVLAEGLYILVAFDEDNRNKAVVKFRVTR